MHPAFLKKPDDGQMLRAGGFTLSALDAVRRTALALGDNGIFTAGAEFRAALFPIGDIEDFRNRNAHGTALGAVMAGGAGNGFVTVQGFLGLMDDIIFMGTERLEILHVAQVVLHLGKAAHAA